MKRDFVVLGVVFPFIAGFLGWMGAVAEGGALHQQGLALWVSCLLCGVLLYSVMLLVLALAGGLSGRLSSSVAYCHNFSFASLACVALVGGTALPLLVSGDLFR